MFDKYFLNVNETTMKNDYIKNLEPTRNIHVCMCICVYVCLCVCMCVCVYISASVTLKAKQQTDSDGERSSIFQMPWDNRAVRISPPSWSPAGSWGQSIQAVTWDLPGLRRQRPDSNQQACLKESFRTRTTRAHTGTWERVSVLEK